MHFAGLLYAFEALEACDGAVRSGVPEPVRAVRSIVGLEVAVAAMEGRAFEARLTDQRERGIENGLATKGVERVLDVGAHHAGRPMRGRPRGLEERTNEQRPPDGAILRTAPNLAHVARRAGEESHHWN